MVGKRSVGSVAFDSANVVVLVLVTILCVLPVWYILSVSLSSKAAAAAGRVVLWPVDFTTIAYRQIIDDPRFFRAFWVSIQRVFLSGVTYFIVTVLVAYPLSKEREAFPARNFFMWVLVFTMLFNGGLVPWYLTIKSYGLLNNIWALVLASSAPVYNIILVVNYFRGLPKEVEESAVVDGAGPWRILFQLIVPLATPVLATVTLFTLVFHWNEFFQGLVLMTQQRNYPLQTYIQQLVVVIDTSRMNEDDLRLLNELSNQTLNAAKIFIAMIPVLVVYPFLQRYFVTGITLGSVKG